MGMPYVFLLCASLKLPWSHMQLYWGGGGGGGGGVQRSTAIGTVNNLLAIPLIW